MAVIDTKNYEFIGYTRFEDWRDPLDTFDVCDHITLIGKLRHDGGGSEYTTDIYIYCKKCKKTYLIIELIN